MLKPTLRKQQSQNSIKKTSTSKPSQVLTFASPRPKKVKKRPPNQQVKHPQLKQLSPKKDLFSSLQDLPKPGSTRQRKIGLKTEQNVQNGRQDSTINTHEHLKYQKSKHKVYDSPNKEYFGHQDSFPEIKSFSTQRSFSRLSKPNLTRSLEKMIKEYRLIDSEAESEESSVNSELSERELRRLKRMQLIRKMELMEDIVSIEETLQRNRKRSKKHRQH